MLQETSMRLVLQTTVPHKPHHVLSAYKGTELTDLLLKVLSGKGQLNPDCSSQA